MLRRLLPISLGLMLLAGLVPGRAFAARPPWGVGQSRGEDLDVYLVTFGPGPEIISWFGHTALVVEDHRLHQQRLYNYGMFSFGPDMLPKFAMGRLEFWVDEEPRVNAVYNFYARENRDVIIQRLNLPPERRLQLAKSLSDNVLPENATYLYHHYFDNCATRPRDMVDSAVGSGLRAVGKEPGRMTLRDHTRRYSNYLPPMSVLLDFLMNDEIDKPITRWEEAFLPTELMHQVDEAKVPSTGQPLVAQKTVWFKGSRAYPPAEVPRYGPWLLLIGLAFGAAAAGLGFWHKKRGSRLARVLLGIEHALVGLVLGLPGTVLLVMWMITNHTVTWRNENLLLANPVTLAALPLGLMLAFGSKKAAVRLRSVWTFLTATGVLAILIKVLPVFDQDNWRIIALILPVSLGMAAASLLLAPFAAKSAAAQPVTR